MILEQLRGVVAEQNVQMSSAFKPNPTTHELSRKKKDLQMAVF